MKIKKFIEFIEESYLNGSRQPLYHLTSRLYSILESDILKCSKPARTTHGYDKSISLTRNIDFTLDGSGHNQIIELDTDKLLKSGIKPYPVEEISWEDGKPNKDTMDAGRNFTKSGFDEFKDGIRGTKHNLDLPTEFVLETEYEERIYKDIPNLGKYLISLSFMVEPSGEGEIEIIKDYITKYPEIKVYLITWKDRRNRTDITYKFSGVKDQVKSEL